MAASIRWRKGCSKEVRARVLTAYEKAEMKNPDHYHRLVEGYDLQSVACTQTNKSERQ